MAVNNFAPAEFGGYVLGANSGGGGGSSVFDEQYGIAGWYSVELTFQLPEMSEDSLEGAPVSVSINIYDESSNLLQITNTHGLNALAISDNKYMVRVPYLTRNDVRSAFSISDVYTPHNGYVQTEAEITPTTGGVEYDRDHDEYTVTGDGSALIKLQYMD